MELLLLLKSRQDSHIHFIIIYKTKKFSHFMRENTEELSKEENKVQGIIQVQGIIRIFKDINKV